MTLEFGCSLQEVGAIIEFGVRERLLRDSFHPVRGLIALIPVGGAQFFQGSQQLLIMLLRFFVAFCGPGFQSLKAKISTGDTEESDRISAELKSVLHEHAQNLRKMIAEARDRLKTTGMGTLSLRPL